MDEPVRVRYAPSPTGSQHVGGARTALFNMLFARHHGGAFVLRIEDTDLDRTAEGSLEAIIDALKWVGVRWDEGPDVGGAYGPYRQSERLARYREAARRLVDAELAYPCFCSRERLMEAREQAREAHRPPGYDGRCRAFTEEERQAEPRKASSEVLRLNVRRVAGDDGPIIVSDILRGDVSFELGVIDDFVIMKSDGTPTYNFAAAIDDHAMAISHVIRGEEHLSNTPKQLLVCRALGISPPQFAHLPMVLAPDRSKLSKRHGATAVEEFRAQGYVPEAMANYLLLLGWSHPSEAELFDLEAAAEAFELDRVSHTAAVYDVKKLAWMNGMYLRSLPVEEIASRVRPFLDEQGIDAGQGPKADAELVRFVGLTRERAQTLHDLALALEYFYREIEAYDADGERKHFGPDAGRFLEGALRAMRQAEAEGFEDAALSSAFTREAELLGVARAKLIHPTRLAVTGRTVGPSLFETVAALGFTICERRVKRAIQRVEALSAH